MMKKLCRKYFLYNSFCSITKHSFSDRLFTDRYDMLYFYMAAFLYLETLQGKAVHFRDLPILS